MCPTQAHADAHASQHAQQPTSCHCGHDDLTLEELKAQRAQLDRDITARDPANTDAVGLHYTGHYTG
jgi:hypothetical protein